MLFDVVSLIKAIGYGGLFGIIFAESGLLIGFFFPGDSLLFTAGFLASQGFLNILIVIAGSFVAAVLGDSVGYATGHKWGRRLFERKESRFFCKENLERAERFYEKYGGKTIVLARFIPVVRTFAPIVAGIGSMRYSRFLFYNVFGGIIWAIGLPAAGFWLGSAILDADRYLLPIIAFIIIVSILPGLWHFLKARRES